MSSPLDDRLDLGRGDCHVWRVLLDVPLAAVAHLRGLLSAEERARAGRFVFETDRNRYVAAHGCLREILAGYVGAAPASLAFASGSSGKPALAPPHRGLRFNLSHSRGLAVVAVARDREVGVDVEAVRAVQDLDDLAASCFSPAEIQALAAVPEASRLEAFFDGWTRKEAFVKVLGDGLSRPLDSFDVTLAPGEPARLLRVAGARAADWAIQQVEVGPGYRGALAIEGPAAAIRFRDRPLDVGRRAVGGREEYLLRRVCAQGEPRQETPR